MHVAQNASGKAQPDLSHDDPWIPRSAHAKFHADTGSRNLVIHIQLYLRIFKHRSQYQEILQIFPVQLKALHLAHFSSKSEILTCDIIHLETKSYRYISC